mgnify:CR=1 FL=1
MERLRERERERDRRERERDRERERVSLVSRMAILRSGEISAFLLIAAFRDA